MSKILTQDSLPVEQLHQMLRSGSQVWVRCPSKIIGGMERHWSRARLVGFSRDNAIIKPIKHGGRLEKVPISTIRLWKSMNAKKQNEQTKISASAMAVRLRRR
jgi:hypothetical protein